MKLGAEPKKVAILVGLMVVAIIVFFMNSSGGPSSSSPSATKSAAGIKVPVQQQVAEVPTGRPLPVSAPRPSSRQGRVLTEFKPTMKPKRPEDRPDPMTVDPTLRTDVLAKLQAVNVEGMHRSLFEFGQAPPPPPNTVAGGIKPPVPSPLAGRFIGPMPAPPPAPPPQPPPPPPIPMKFYGYTNVASSTAIKRAFFLEGEDIHVVHEGDLIKRRYKIIRIGLSSVVVEDTQYKNQQTLPLEEQPG